MEKKIIGRCPLCGGNVVKTCKGYRCENNIAEQPTCVLNINGIIGNRKMSDEEITELLEHRFILLDGFASKGRCVVMHDAPLFCSSLYKSVYFLQAAIIRRFL